MRVHCTPEPTQMPTYTCADTIYTRLHTYDKDKETLKRRMPSRLLALYRRSIGADATVATLHHASTVALCTAFVLPFVLPAKLLAHGVFCACRRFCRITSGHTTLETLIQMTVPKDYMAHIVAAASKLLAAPLLAGTGCHQYFIFSPIWWEKNGILLFF